MEKEEWTKEETPLLRDNLKTEHLLNTIKE